MTPNETLKALRKAGKPIVRSHFYRLTATLHIKPLGSSRPQQYPADTAARILAHLGFSSADEMPASSGLKNGRTDKAMPAAGKLISPAALRAAKPKHTTKGKK
jgi:hypothetical protein